MINIYQTLKKKTELLCKGIYLNPDLIPYYQKQGINLNYGRKGGAGPLGGRYFLFKDKTLVNVVLWDSIEQTNLSLKKKEGEYFKVIDREKNNNFGELILVNNPKFYDLKTKDGIEMKKIALVHGIDCLASTIYQKCIYWACDKACKFCGIQLSLDTGETIEEKTPEQLSEVMTAAIKENRCSHVTLTSGTTAEKDKGTSRYVQILKKLKKDHPTIPLHVQIEPLKDLKYIDELRSAGADTIGIHLEIFNENLRKQFTPGKAHIPRKQFELNWIHALEIFGKNQVETFILAGFEEFNAEFISNLERVVSLGVIPFITPVRTIPSKKPIVPPLNHENLLKLYEVAGTLMRNYGVNPLEFKAGCVRCGGCSAIKEAYRAMN
ncbi:MAG: radical SAM protein [Promethearchaeota archaeon]